MAVLDTSAIIQYLRGDERVRQYIENREPWLTSAVCVSEVVDGRVGHRRTDVIDVRREFDDVHTLDLNETIALEAGRLQAQLEGEGNRLATIDLLVAATARSTGDELVVADEDFDTPVLTDVLSVTNLHGDAGS